MAKSLATYYLDELSDWNSTLRFFNTEITELTGKLNDVVRRNTITGIAGKVEGQQALLNKFVAEFADLQQEMQKQENELKKGNGMIDNTLIDAEIENRQNRLRRIMQAVEKSYIDMKFDCHDFLSKMIRKQNE